MEHVEMEQKLHEKANISEEEARAALEATGWDMLAALQLLESQGKIAPLTASMTTTGEQDSYEKIEPTAAGTRGGKKGLLDRIRDLLDRSMVCHFIVRRKGKTVLDFPVILMIIIALFAFKVVLAVGVVGLFCECSYSVEKENGDD